MNYPHMLVMRNQPDGMIWQAYRVENDKEKELITRGATRNYFLVYEEPEGYCEETTPDWRDTKEWKEYLAANL